MDKPYIIGIDLGATNIKFGLIANNKILFKKILPTKKFSTKKKLIEVLICGIKEMISSARDRKFSISRSNILGVGLGVPGPVDYKKGIVHYFPNIKGWRNVGLQKIIQKEIGLPVFIDNDANLMTLAEARVGAGKGKNNVIGITLGTGVGGGIVLNGSLFRGTAFVAGEIGHIPINETGPKCNCGGIACLERYVGNRYILENACRFFGNDITLEKLSELAKRGNKKAVGIWKDVAFRIGVALSGVINFINPEVIVIGGGIASAGRVIFDNIRRVVKKRAMLVQRRMVIIVKAKLGNDAGMIGAALLVKEGYSNSE